MTEYEIGIAGVDFDDDELSGIPAPIRPQVKQLAQKKAAQAVNSSVHTRNQKIGLVKAGKLSDDVVGAINSGARIFKNAVHFIAVTLGNAPKGKVVVLDQSTTVVKGVSTVNGNNGLNDPFMVESVEVEAVIAADTTAVAAANYDKGVGGITYAPLRNSELVITQNGEVLRYPLSEHDLVTASPDRDTFKYKLDNPVMLRDKTPFSVEVDMPNTTATMTAGQALYLRVNLHGQSLAAKAGN